MKRVTVKVPQELYDALVRGEPWARSALDAAEDLLRRRVIFFGLVQKDTLAEKTRRYVEKELDPDPQADGWDDIEPLDED